MSTTEFSKELIILANALWDHGAIQFGDHHDFKHQQSDPDALASPYKISIRPPKVTQEGTLAIAHAFYDAINASYPEFTDPNKVAHILGIPKVGDALAAIYSQRSKVNLLRVIKKELEDGRRYLTNTIMGKFKLDDQVVGVDDIVNRGLSKLEFDQVLTINRLDLKKFFVIVDREEGGLEMLQKMGFPITALLKSRSLFQYYSENRPLSSELYDQVTTFIQTQRKV